MIQNGTDESTLHLLDAIRSRESSVTINLQNSSSVNHKGTRAALEFHFGKKNAPKKNNSSKNVGRQQVIHKSINI